VSAFADMNVDTTFEGDNTVLMAQARWGHTAKLWAVLHSQADVLVGATARLALCWSCELESNLSAVRIERVEPRVELKCTLNSQVAKPLLDAAVKAGMTSAPPPPKASGGGRRLVHRSVSHCHWQ